MQVHRTFSIKVDEVFFATVRLIGGSNVVSHGRVEVYNRGIWEAVCSDDWDLKDANVVCHQLGFEGALTETKLGAFGRGTKGRWRDDVRCTGNESSFSVCE